MAKRRSREFGLCPANLDAKTSPDVFAAAHNNPLTGAALGPYIMTVVAVQQNPRREQ